MDCPASVEIIEVDEEGQNIVTGVLPCTGTLEGPVPNAKTGNVESVAMGNDTFGRAWYCSTCGQTTLVPDIRDAGGA